MRHRPAPGTHEGNLLQSHLPRQRAAWHAVLLGTFMALTLVFAVGYAALEWADTRQDKSYYGMTIIFGGLFAGLGALFVGPLSGFSFLRTRRRFWQEWGIMIGMLTISGIIPGYIFFLATPFL